jgi:hypothetical protein
MSVLNIIYGHIKDGSIRLNNILEEIKIQKAHIAFWIFYLIKQAIIFKKENYFF